MTDWDLFEWVEHLGVFNQVVWAPQFHWGTKQTKRGAPCETSGPRCWAFSRAHNMQHALTGKACVCVWVPCVTAPSFRLFWFPGSKMMFLKHVQVSSWVSVSSLTACLLVIKSKFILFIFSFILWDDVLPGLCILLCTMAFKEMFNSIHVCFLHVKCGVCVYRESFKARSSSSRGKWETFQCGNLLSCQSSFTGTFCLSFDISYVTFEESRWCKRRLFSHTAIALLLRSPHPEDQQLPPWSRRWCECLDHPFPKTCQQ